MAREARRSRLEWQRIVEQQRESGLAIREFCRREDLKYETFRRWRSEILHASMSCPTDQSVAGSPAFLALTVRDGTTAAVEPGAVEILFQGDERRARIRADCPVELAVAITATLRGGGPCS